MYRGTNASQWMVLMQLVNKMNRVSLNPPGHLRVLKAYRVAEMIRRNGKKRPVIKLVSTPEQTRMRMFFSKMCLVEAGSKISQQTLTPT